MALVHQIRIGPLLIGGNSPLVFIVGPCVIESSAHAVDIALEIAEIASRTNAPIIFKASYDKANRTSIDSFRGPGLASGLQTLSKIKSQAKLPLLTDIHEPSHAGPVAEVVDVIQIPAFLSRQTDLLLAAANTGKPVNVKKGQFLSPKDMRHVIDKVLSTGNHDVLITERGVSFGYNNLVVDMRAFPILRELGYPVIFDATHSLQLPGAGSGITTGLSHYIEPLSAAGVAAGIDGLFLEVHDNPKKAKSDGGNSLRLDALEPLIQKLLQIDSVVRKKPTPLSKQERT
jgi:2-dehydro-3-deoxyphosphooctonate aldolase (KDO 8-P synthase)